MNSREIVEMLIANYERELAKTGLQPDSRVQAYATLLLARRTVT